MRPIPPKVREQLATDPRMKVCVINDESCSGRIEWHHVWMYAGRQINEVWAIVGACQHHHAMVNRNPRIKKIFMAASLREATDKDLEKYPRINWAQTKRSLGMLGLLPVSQTEEEKQRTLQQNRALHLFFRMIADHLNDAGLDMRTVLKPDIEIPWSPGTVKNYLWRPIQRLQLGKRSTTELTTKDIDVIYDTLNRHLAKFGVHEPFPSIEELIAQQLGRKKVKK